MVKAGVKQDSTAKKIKIGPMLASKLSASPRTHYLPGIRVAGNPPSADPIKVLEAFRGFYTNLYSMSPSNKDPMISGFLQDLLIPTLTAEHKDVIEASISIEEIKTSRRAQLLGRTVYQYHITKPLQTF